MELYFVRKHPEVGDVVSYYFRSPQPIAWQAGQYMKYFLEHPNPDEKGIKRYFTISTAPFEKNIRITTHLTQSSFKQYLNTMQPDQPIVAEGPRGDFVFTNPNNLHVFIAGGIGITPFRSILQELHHNNADMNVILLYANRDDNIVFKHELDELALQHPYLKIHYITSPQRIDENLIRSIIKDINSPHYYVSGPEPMVISLVDQLKEMGVAEDKIKRDDFPGYDWPEGK